MLESCGTSVAGYDQISKLKNSSQILRERHAYHAQHPEKINIYIYIYDHMKESINRIDFACTSFVSKGYVSLLCWEI